MKGKTYEVKPEKILSSQNYEVKKSTPIDTMSEYEKVRAKKIERNNSVLKNLGLMSVKEEQISNASAWCLNAVESGEKVKRRTANKIVLKKRDMQQTVISIESEDKVDTVPKTILPECEKEGKKKDEIKKPEEKNTPKSTTNKSWKKWKSLK